MTDPEKPNPQDDPATPSPPASAASKPSSAQPRNPLHGITLEAILERLVANFGWAGLAERVPLRCFVAEPSINSSLKFLRKTPWAREKVEGLYLYMLREQARHRVARK